MPRPKLYADTAARMRAYRARKAEGTVTPAPAKESLQAYRERMDKAAARATSQPSDFEPMTLGDLAAGKSPVKRKVTPTITPVVHGAFGRLESYCGLRGKALKGLTVTRLDADATCETCRRVLVKEHGADISPIVTPKAVTPAPELRVGQVFTISKFWIEKDGKEMQVPMRFRIDNLPEGDGDFHTHRGGMYKGRKFATAILEVIEEPKPVTVTKPTEKELRKRLWHLRRELTKCERMNERIDYWNEQSPIEREACNPDITEASREAHYEHTDKLCAEVQQIADALKVFKANGPKI